MKQHITVEQLKEANDLQLRQICHMLNWSTLQTNMEWMFVSEWLTIGVMINILETQAMDNGVELFVQMELRADGWFIGIYQYYMCKGERQRHLFMYYMTDKKDRCDALWEATKDVL